LPECVKAHLATWNFNFFQGRTQILAFWGGLKERLEMGEGEGKELEEGVEEGRERWEREALSKTKIYHYTTEHMQNELQVVCFTDKHFCMT